MLGWSGPLGPGLCSECRHARRIETNRGSVFILCLLSHANPAFARYPNLPVLACRGHEKVTPYPKNSETE